MSNNNNTNTKPNVKKNNTNTPTDKGKTTTGAISSVAIAKVKKSGVEKKKGTVGAPQKEIKWPHRAFTINDVILLNPDICELTIRNRVAALTSGYKTVVRVVDGVPVKTQVPVEPTLIKIGVTDETRIGIFPLRRNGKVGRPRHLYILKDKYMPNDILVQEIMKPNKSNNNTPKTVATCK